MRRCDWCKKPMPDRDPDTGQKLRSDAETCGVVCRKRRWRFRSAIARGITPRVRRVVRQVGPAARFAYADPPYPGKAGYYADHEDYGGEVDHAELVSRLDRDFPDGWALSTRSGALREVLPLCPVGARVCVWRRRVRHVPSRRALSSWEPLIVVGGRPLATDVPQDLLDDLVTDGVLEYEGRYGSFPGALIGMKPPEFAVWLFRQLGAGPRDSLEDVFPGSGAIGRAWLEYVTQTSLLTTATEDA